MSFGEIIVILVVAILVLGPDKLPEAIVQIAKILKAVKRNIDDAKSSIEKEIRINDLKEEAKKYKDEFSSTNENIRKKLSFEEFDDLKRDILDKTKVDLTFDSRDDNTKNNLSGQNLNTEEKPNLTRLETQDKTEK
ncbi:TPA: Sec-independent protein translocase subunit TatB [Campylobacter jejuni]|uniref:Sec-independent protein translocase protein TatB homolog n=1 Tax=Campylobacter jejuni TaxID=197 RepID=A0A5Y9KHT9_CAMJU|nr:Sec-independent protein translocase protein TatB [Campylobacter jejuni]AIW09826.1 preprotein translocase subunit TatB [Campylobacter jejuni subsp. jejuni F38011]EAH4889817.1 Sec-independent protein translocase subunit TatB [Campylobacter jejuni]EAH5842187.1 Sec-independent protein translocase subunit TatB [Campylobacter jejuni]EAH6699231.1 Sec-independent protein translocase subunit TatB [Campylobacter jejuni]EAH6880730.1 Sec-independent protein translocase subunit TatB [Campylobacter jejun